MGLTSFLVWRHIGMPPDGDQKQAKVTDALLSLRRRGGWLRKTTTPTGPRPVGPPPAVPTEKQDTPARGK